MSHLTLKSSPEDRAALDARVAESLESIEPLADLIDAYLRGGPDRYVDLLELPAPIASPPRLADRATLITLSKLATAVELMRVEGLLSRGGPAPGPVPDDETSLTAALPPASTGRFASLRTRWTLRRLRRSKRRCPSSRRTRRRAFRDRSFAPVAWQLAYEAWDLRRRGARQRITRAVSLARDLRTSC